MKALKGLFSSILEMVFSKDSPYQRYSSSSLWWCQICDRVHPEDKLTGEGDWLDGYCPRCKAHRTRMSRIYVDQLWEKERRKHLERGL